MTLSSPLDRPGVAADANTFSDPPDPTGAIGRGQYIEVVNDKITVYARSDLRPIARTGLTAFWDTGYSSVIDPQIAWDDHYRRWYFATLRVGGAEPNGLLFAWSKSADPSNLKSGWCRHEIRSGDLVEDFPKLGFSAHQILIGTNVGREGKVLFSRIWAIGQPPGAAGGSCARPAITSFPSSGHELRDAAGHKAFTPVAVVPIRGASGGYVVAAECVDDPNDGGEPAETGCHKTGRFITIWRVTGPAGRPRLVRVGAITVPAYRLPSSVPQPRTTRLLDTSDTRLTQAVESPYPNHPGGTLIWTQHTVAAPGGRSEVRWYALDPRELRIVAHGTIRHPGEWVFNAAIAPITGGKEAIIDYNVGGPKLLPEIRAQVAGDPHRELKLARSAAPHETCEPPPEDPYCRWGDYAAATTDPTRPDVVWGTNEFTAPLSQDPFGLHWGTQNFALAIHGSRTAADLSRSDPNE